MPRGQGTFHRVVRREESEFNALPRKIGKQKDDHCAAFGGGDSGRNGDYAIESSGDLEMNA